jgi:hypothetical protein
VVDVDDAFTAIFADGLAALVSVFGFTADALVAVLVVVAGGLALELDATVLVAVDELLVPFGLAVAAYRIARETHFTVCMFPCL